MMSINRLNTTARLVLPEADGMDLERFFLVTGRGAQGRVSLPGNRVTHTDRLELIRDAAARVRDRRRGH